MVQFDESKVDLVRYSLIQVISNKPPYSFMWEGFQKCNVWHNSFIIIFRLDHDIQYSGANFAFLGLTFSYVLMVLP